MLDRIDRILPTRVRPCLVNGRKALFHKWIEQKYIIEPSFTKGLTDGGQISNNYALIEYENGSCSIANIESVIFLDDVFKEFNFDRVDEDE